MHPQNEFANKNPISLNEIICQILDRAAADQDTPYFDFIKIHDQAVMNEIKKYSLDIRKIDFSKMDRQQIEDMVESVSTNLYDNISQSNLDYFRHGIKIGARLLAELVI